MKNVLLVAALAGFLSVSDALGVAGKAIVNNVVGTATYSGPRGSGPLVKGAILLTGDQVQTKENSYVDLNLGVNGDALRVEEGTQLTLTELTFGSAKTRSGVVTELNLSKGKVVANVVRKLTRDSRYRIRTPRGVAGIRGTATEIGTTVIKTSFGTVTFTPVGGGIEVSISANQAAVLTAANITPQNMSLSEATITAKTTIAASVGGGLAATDVAQTIQALTTAVAAAAATEAAAAANTANAGATPAVRKQAVAAAAADAASKAAATVAGELQKAMVGAQGDALVQAGQQTVANLEKQADAQKAAAALKTAGETSGSATDAEIAAALGVSAADDATVAKVKALLDSPQTPTELQAAATQNTQSAQAATALSQAGNTVNTQVIQAAAVNAAATATTVAVLSNGGTAGDATSAVNSIVLSSANVNTIVSTAAGSDTTGGMDATTQTAVTTAARTQTADTVLTVQTAIATGGDTASVVSSTAEQTAGNVVATSAAAGTTLQTAPATTTDAGAGDGAANATTPPAVDTLPASPTAP